MYKKVLITAIALMISCVSSRYLVAPNSNINAYKYVVVYPPRYDLYSIEFDVVSLLTTAGFTIIDENEYLNLDKLERRKVLACTYSYSSTPALCELDIKLKDVKNGNRTIYTGNGTYGVGMLPKGDAIGALRQALLGLSRIYTGYDKATEQSYLEKFSKRESIEIEDSKIYQYLMENQSQLNPIEGIWTEKSDNGYKIAILKDTISTSRDYVGIILSSDAIEWKKHQIKVEFTKTNQDKIYTVRYFMADHSKQNTIANIDEFGILNIQLESKNNFSFTSKFLRNYPLHGSVAQKISKKKTQSSGSGFLISRDGTVITNYHVIESYETIEIHCPALNRDFPANILIKDATNDIAVLKLENFKYDSLYSTRIPYGIVSSKSISTGYNSYTLGYPLDGLLGSSAKLSRGSISSVFGVQDDPRVFQISNPIQPGNSGSPLFSEQGELIGLVVSSLNADLLFKTASIIPQNVNFAIKSDYLINLISMLPNSSEILSNTTSIQNLELPKQIEAIDPFIYLIQCK